MKQLWRKLAARFDACAPRERLTLAGGLLLGIVLLGYSFVIEPQLLRQARAAKAATDAQAELPRIEAALVVAEAQLRDPDAGKRVALQQARKDIEALDARLRALSASLLPPERMPVFLESLLAKNSRLELLSLRTLPPGFLIDRGETAGKGAAPNIYKHGVELRIGGSYSDLLAYLDELERMPQRILWSKLTLTSEQYPRSVLTLTVYTLSLDKQWLVV